MPTVLIGDIMVKRAATKSSVEDVFFTLYHNDEIATKVLKEAAAHRIPTEEKYRLENWVQWRKEPESVRFSVRREAHTKRISPEEAYEQTRKAA